MKLLLLVGCISVGLNVVAMNLSEQPAHKKRKTVKRDWRFANVQIQDNLWAKFGIEQTPDSDQKMQKDGASSERVEPPIPQFSTRTTSCSLCAIQAAVIRDLQAKNAIMRERQQNFIKSQEIFRVAVSQMLNGILREISALKKEQAEIKTLLAVSIALQQESNPELTLLIDELIGAGQESEKFNTYDEQNTND